MIEIDCSACGMSFVVQVFMGAGETRHQPAEPDTVEPEECPACGADTDAGLAVELHKDRCDHEREAAADGERKRENE